LFIVANRVPRRADDKRDKRGAKAKAAAAARSPVTAAWKGDSQAGTRPQSELETWNIEHARPTIRALMDTASAPGRAMAALERADGRRPDELRPLRFQNHIAPHASGSTLVEWGSTRVICAVMIEESVPKWMKDQNVPGGWITAEYAMLPYSTLTRKQRDSTRGKVDGRSTEIQRLIGRAMRAAVDLDKVGPRTIWVDCDVLQADGGTRTAAITGAFVALSLAVRKLQSEGKLAADPIANAVAAVSVGIVSGVPMLDLCYTEDAAAEVDMNLVMTGKGEFIELQGTGEEATFDQAQLAAMLELGKAGIQQLLAAQREALELKE
jgi:ribonuclease PH